jgi:8-amino-7-oxononanoate synthase
MMTTNDPPLVSLESLLQDELAQRAQSGLLRTRRIVEILDAVHVLIDGRQLVNFSSNNYLGLTHHPKIISAMQSAAGNGVGSGAAGLISGYTSVHRSAESAIARWKKTESAVLLPSGYQANFAAIQTLAALGSGGVRFLIDKLAHASLLDAVRSTGSPWRVFPHNNLARLRRMLEKSNPNQLQVVVTESIFSMDGDAAPLRELAELKREFNFVLFVDEAHGSGVYGPGGCGLIGEIGVFDAVDVCVVTFSKAAGCIGGAVCGSEEFYRMLLNAGRAYIYSTSVPPPIAAAIEAAIGVMRDEPERQNRLRDLARSTRENLRAAGVKIPDGDSPIIPIILGSESAAMESSEKLFEAGLLVSAVRPPTVARGTSRLRVTLSSEHSDEELAALLENLKILLRRAGPDRSP